ncbi:sialin-like isoform X1 [Biomphalaria glabrata]|nr:sialin-like isoform X1 [Biomphalaria glabrata]
MAHVKAPYFVSQRFVWALLSCLGIVLHTVTRDNIHAAISCMVNHDIQNLTSVNSDVDRGRNITYICGGHVEYNVTRDFDWDEETVRQLLSVYFYGQLLTQIPASWLALRYSARLMWASGMAIGSLCTLLTPVSARTHVYLLLAVRFILGLSGGLTFPCVTTMEGKWCTPNERTKLASIVFAGTSLGSIYIFSTTGVLCEEGFDIGWAAIFYFTGIFSFLWVFVWIFMTADTPVNHKWISDWERLYIDTNIGKVNLTKVQSVPWRKMLKSGPVWAIVIAHCCDSYVTYTILNLVPLYTSENLGFHIMQHGPLLGLPFVCMTVMCIAVGHLADTIRERGHLTTKTVMRSTQMFASLGTSVTLSLVGHVTCESRGVAFVLLCLMGMCIGFNRAGFMVNHLDLAPRLSGILFSISATFGTVPWMVTPYVAEALMPNRSQAEWRNVFYVCSSVSVFGALLFGILADGDLQEWFRSREVFQDYGDRHELAGSVGRRVRNNFFSNPDENTVLVESET